jgi:hypothetical protein
MNTESPPRNRIPLWLKLAYSAFMAVLIPVYSYQYGPTNFLYFCDIAILVTLVAIWMESPLLVSMQAVGIILPQMLWVVEFILKGLTGKSLLGVADYMYNPKIPLFARCLSSFHGWLPFLLLYLVWKLGYDRRALIVQAIACWVILLVCYLFTPPPPARTGDRWEQVNINYVYGIGEERPQQWMRPALWMAMLMTVLPVGIYLPTHFLLDKAFGPRKVARGFPVAAALPSGGG